MSRECHNNKPQPQPQTPRGRGQNMQDKQTHAPEASRAKSFPSKVVMILNGTEQKHENKEEGNTQQNASYLKPQGQKK